MTAQTDYMRNYRQQQRQGRSPTTRDRVLALLMQHGSLTSVQLVEHLGPTYSQRMLHYQLHCLLTWKQIAREPRRRTPRDRSLFTYRLVPHAKS